MGVIRQVKDFSVKENFTKSDGFSNAIYNFIMSFLYVNHMLLAMAKNVREGLSFCTTDSAASRNISPTGFILVSGYNIDE